MPAAHPAPPSLPPPPREVDQEAARKFRDAAAAAGFDGDIFAILGAVGPPGWKASMRSALPSLPSAACGTLAKFFIVGDAVTRGELTPALGGEDVLAALEHSGWAIAATDTSVRCPYLMMAAGGVFALSDAVEDPVSLHPHDDYIIPIAATSQNVDDLAVRVPCELAVDMGCGQGYLALRSLAHAKRCIGTDINPRALDFARANASLHGAAGRLDWRLGNLFEPLQDAMGEVDLFTCNPPFIINPGAHTTASETAGDHFLETLVRQSPRWLREGGWATVIGLWEHADRAGWEARAKGWLEGSGCDGLVLRFGTFSADEYFRSSTPPDSRAAAEPAWKRLCETRGIGALTYGGFVLRKRGAPNWYRSLTTPIDARTGSASAQLLAYFATQTALEFGTSLLDSRLRMAPGWRYDPRQPLPADAPQGAPGLALPLVMAAQIEPVLAAFDGNVTARQALAWLHQGGAGQWPHAPEHPESQGMLRWLLVGGSLELA